MQSRARFRFVVALLSTIPLHAAVVSSSKSWTQIKTGPFIVYSEAPAKQTREVAAELEQFRFALGQLLGVKEMRLDPALEVYLWSQAPPQTGPVTTRTGAVALRQGVGPLTVENRKELAKLLLDQNVGRMPAPIEQGLETFLSTAQLNGAHLTWGAPPEPAQRTFDWALIAWLVTNPDTYGNVRVFLANLEKNVEEGVAYRNSVHKSPEEVKGEVQGYLASGNFRTIDAPSRPLSPERDLGVHPVSGGEMQLHLADLLDHESEGRYRELLNAGQHRAEDEEGLGLLAARRGDAKAAGEWLEKAVADGSKNAAALVEYAAIEHDTAKARTALEKAIVADPNSAAAHFALGEKLTDPVKQYEQWSIATKLAPRKEEYWVALAKNLQDQKRFELAAQAWSGAEQAAPTSEEREKMISARIAVEGQRLDFDDAEKRKEEEAHQQEIDRLKEQTRAEIRAAEAKVNSGTADAAEANAVPWDQFSSTSSHAEGQMVRIECEGRRMRLVLQLKGGKTLKLNANLATLTVAGASGATLACGPQNPRAVSVSYDAQADAKNGVAGMATSIDFH